MKRKAGQWRKLYWAYHLKLTDLSQARRVLRRLTRKKVRRANAVAGGR